MPVLTRRLSRSKSCNHEPASLSPPRSKTKTLNKEIGKVNKSRYTSPTTKQSMKTPTPKDQKLISPNSEDPKNLTQEKPNKNTWYLLERIPDMMNTGTIVALKRSMKDQTTNDPESLLKNHTTPTPDKIISKPPTLANNTSANSLKSATSPKSEIHNSLKMDYRPFVASRL